MESRVSRIEAILPTLARKEDLAILDGKLSEKISNFEIKVEAKFNAFDLKLNAFDTKLTAMDGKLTSLIHKEIAMASWRMIIWATGVITIAFGGAFFIACHVS
jgi:hypothetical protein